MEDSKKFAMIFTIYLIVLLVFGNIGVLATGVDAPAPSPPMENAGVTLFVPIPMAVIASLCWHLDNFREKILEGQMECSKKFVVVFTICLMVLLAFGNVGVLAAEAPAPSPTMESAGVTLFVPLLMAVIASMAAVFF